jgi:hypothetical protein
MHCLAGDRHRANVEMTNGLRTLVHAGWPLRYRFPNLARSRAFEQIARAVSDLPEMSSLLEARTGLRHGLHAWFRSDFSAEPQNLRPAQ